MPPNTVWSDHLNKSELKLSVRGMEWKNLMNECLMATQIKKMEVFSDQQLNPNTVMDIRHQRVKKCAKTSPPEAQIQKEQLKSVQEEKNKKLTCIKEEKLVDKEIVKLKQILESYQTLTREKLETDEKRKSLQLLPKINDRIIKLKVSQVNKPYQMKQIMRISKKILEETKNYEHRSYEKENIRDKDKILRTDDKSCEKIFAKFSKEKENERKEVVEAEGKPLFQFLEVMDQRRLKRAWQKWRIYNERQKVRKKEKRIFVDKIDAFLKNLENSGVKRTTSCQQERRVFKLPPRARTAVDDEERKAKLRKFMQEVKMSQMEILQKLKCRKKEEKTFPNPKFLSQMEARREERLKKWKEIQERKERAEKEKEEKEKREEEEKKQKTEEEKRKRIEELKEKQNAERERKEALKVKKEKIKRDLLLANDHYRKVLLKSYGLRPWLNLIRLRHAQYKQAVEFYHGRLLRMFISWRVTVWEQVEEKRKRADELHNRIVLKQYWWSWTECRKETMRKEQAATDWHDFKVTEKLFKTWVWFTDLKKLEYLDKKGTAESHYKRKLKIKCLEKLKSYPECEKKRREAEIRKLKWRQRVKEILPDYRPFEIMEKN